MTLVVNSAEMSDEPESAYSEAESARLLNRLIDLRAEIVFFPVRHHSPAGAVHVDEVIERLRPVAVLIEGPSDFNPHLHELQLDHELPIAIYSYFRRGAEHRAAYYPFCEYSPEWSALKAATRIGAEIKLIDLPWTLIADVDRSTHRFADAELRRGKYVQRLCELSRVEDFDELWDQLIESDWHLSLTDYLARVHSLCLHIRLWDQEVSVADLQREAFMVKQIREIQQSRQGVILVITGGYHSSALAAALEPSLNLSVDPAVLFESKPAAQVEPELGDKLAAMEPIIDVGIALTSYSYERLDSLTGYNAGMPSPGFYDHNFRQRIRRSGSLQFDHHPLLIDLIGELRKRKQTISTADLVAVETTARGLAAIRGRSSVWRSDLVDAVTSSLVKDEQEYAGRSPWRVAIQAVLRGDRRGRLATGTRLPPLVVEIRKRLEADELVAQSNPREIKLDLLSPQEIEKSRLLHQLTLLGIRGYECVQGTDFVRRGDLSQLNEVWRMKWSPEFEASCIEAAKYGTSLVDATASVLLEMAHQVERDAAVAAGLMVRAAQAGVDSLSADLLSRMRELIQDEPQFGNSANCLAHLLYLYCYDEALGTNRLEVVGDLLHENWLRTLWLLEGLGQTSGDERRLIRGMSGLFETWNRLPQRLCVDRDEFVGVLARVERDPQKPASIRGAAAGILWSMGAANQQEILADLMLFSRPEGLGDFLSGLFAVAREAAQREAELIQTIDRLVNEFGADEFQTALPALRLAFTYFTPREKHYMLSTLFESLGALQLRPLTSLTVSGKEAAECLAFEERLFEAISKYGLEQS